MTFLKIIKNHLKIIQNKIKINLKDKNNNIIILHLMYKEKRIKSNKNLIITQILII